MLPSCLYFYSFVSMIFTLQFFSFRESVSTDSYFKYSTLSFFMFLPTFFLHLDTKSRKIRSDLINCFETPTVNLYLELSVVIYFKGFKVPSSSDKLPRMHVQAQKA